jgi:hypothetical protein
MLNKIISIFLIFVLIFGGVSAIAIDSPSDGADLNNTSFNFELSSLNNTDNNYICFDTSDGCQENDTEISGTNTTISYSSSGLDLSDGTSITIYACEHDGNADTTDTGTCDSISITLDTTEPTISSDEDGDYYSSASGSFNFTVEDATSSIASINYQINSGTVTSMSVSGTSYAISFTDLNEGANTIKIDANDNLGNSASETFTINIDTTPPTASLSVTNDWTNDKTPTLTIGGSGASEMSFSCNNVDYSSYVTYATTYSSFDITSGNGCNSDNDESKNIYIRVRDQAGNTAIANDTISYDGDAPSDSDYEANNFTVTQTDSDEIEVKWKNPDEEENENDQSPWDVFSIFIDGDLEDTENYDDDEDGYYSVKIDGLDEDEKYEVEVCITDEAGNYGSCVDDDITIEGVTVGINVRRDGDRIDTVKEGDDLEITCTFSEETDNTMISYRYESGGNREDLLDDEEDNETSISANHEVDLDDEDYSRIIFYCEGNGVDTESETVYIDMKDPTIEDITSRDVYTGTVDISAVIDDDQGIDSVTFKINNTTIDHDRSGDDYTAEVDTKQFDNGENTLTITAIDEAGNSTTETKKINIQNEIDESDAERAITAANNSKQIVVDLINYFEREGFSFDSNLLNQKEEADSLLEEANILTDPISKKEKADEAKVIYDLISVSANIENDDVIPVEINLEEATEKLSELGISDNDINKIKERAASSNIRRNISIVRSNDDTIAQVKIALNYDSGGEEFKIVEVIPKEFVESASLINSPFEFNIIEDDPVIEFIVPSGTTEISYNVSGLSEEDANRITSQEVTSKFASPPILLNSEENTLKVISGTTLPQIDLILGIVVVIVLILLVAGGILYLQSNGGDFGGNNVISKIKEKIPKKEEKKKKGKWGYKE